jgi:hypothetical protein
LPSRPEAKIARCGATLELACPTIDRRVWLPFAYPRTWWMLGLSLQLEIVIEVLKNVS